MSVLHFAADGAIPHAVRDVDCACREAGELRNSYDLSSGGDYVSPNAVYTAEQLGLDPADGSVSLCLEGINPGESTIEFYVDPDGPSGPIGWILSDTVKVTVVNIDLSVDNNTSLTDAVDGVRNYLPGYEGTTDKLVAGGNTFNTVVYQVQPMKIVTDGVGPNSGITSVEYTIVETTNYAGYAENKTYPSTEGWIWPYADYSFDDDDDADFQVGTLGATKDWVQFYCKDYGGKAIVRVDVKMDGTVVFQYDLGIPIDVDDDGISDKWEREQVASWNTQFGESQTEDFQFFAAEDDKEKQDPDAAGNTDGGTNMPNHKTEGDSLTVLQEYRGFILDGGAGHTGGHKRLSPSKKELLVEVDIMAGVTNMPSEAGIRGIMGTVSSGFGHLTDGAGINLYYVIDETAATHEVFANDSEISSWAASHLHETAGDENMLDEFVYLAFADSFPGSTGGRASNYGAFVFVDSAYAFATAQGYNVTTHRGYIAAHELTHLCINTNGANGFNGDEHLPDPNQSGGYDTGDDDYLMFEYQTGQAIKFSNPTRGQYDLKNKQSVTQ